MNSSSPSPNNKNNSIKQKTYEMTVFAMLGAVMLISKLAMEGIPNVHPLAMLIVTYAVVYRKKALIPIYIYVFLNGFVAGFSLWWIPYLYIWAVLWGMAMLIPKNMSPKIAMIVYPIVCALHGILFGVLYAPAQAIMFNLNFKGMLTWIAAGLSFDLIHCAGNFAMGFLVYPLSKLLKKISGTAAKL